MDLKLAGCAAIVGGASSGMGRAIAETLSEEGCNVVLLARRDTEIREAATTIASRSNGKALPITGDSTDERSLERAVTAALDAFGRIDIVVNNTGGPPAGTFESFDDSAWQAAYELTLLSAIRLTRLALPALRASGRGRIVNNTSSSAKEPDSGLLLSNALRPAVIGWAKTLSREEAGYGITVNNIAPGYIDTERLKYLYSLGDDPDSARRHDEQTIPAGRFGSPSEIGAAAAFLCSAQASYINGITLLVDGGLSKSLLS